MEECYEGVCLSTTKRCVKPEYGRRASAPEPRQHVVQEILYPLGGICASKELGRVGVLGEPPPPATCDRSAASSDSTNPSRMSLRGVHISKTGGRSVVPRPLARPRSATILTSREIDIFWVDSQADFQSMSPASRLPACILPLQSSVNVLATDTAWLFFGQPACSISD